MPVGSTGYTMKARMAKRIADRSSHSVRALAEAGERLLPREERRRHHAERGGRERMPLTGEHSGERGDRERGRRGDLRAFAGTDRLHVEQHDQHADQPERQQGERLAEHAAGGAEHRTKAKVRSPASF